MKERREPEVTTVIHVQMGKEQLYKIFAQKEINEKFMGVMESGTVIPVFADCITQVKNIINMPDKEICNIILEMMKSIVIQDAFNLLVEENLTRNEAILKVISEDLVKSVLKEEVLESFKISAGISKIVEQSIKDFEEFLSREDIDD